MQDFLAGKLKVLNESQDCSYCIVSKEVSKKIPQKKTTIYWFGVQNQRLTIPFTLKGGDPAAPSGTATLLRLHPPYQAYLRHRPPLQVRRATSGTPNSGGVTGGVYKARERIHRAMLMRDY